MRSYWTYIRASKPHGTLYIGVTNDLVHRIDQHRAGKGSAFTRRYSVHTLVWYEEFASARDAIQREKSLKRYNRAGKDNPIEPASRTGWPCICPPLARITRRVFRHVVCAAVLDCAATGLGARDTHACRGQCK